MASSRLLFSNLRSRLLPSLLHLRSSNSKPPPPSILRHLSSYSSSSPRRRPVDIATRARQLQTRRLWTYALTFTSVAGFIIIVINNFQDQLVFYLTPTDALQQHSNNPSKTRFRLGGLVLENSVSHPSNSTHIHFVITDLITDILVTYEGVLPDLFREGHSVVVEGFVRKWEGNEDGLEKGDSTNSKVSEKARGIDCYFKATEVLAKHDEKYMPAEVAAAIERNKKLIEKEKGEAAEVVQS